MDARTRKLGKYSIFLDWSSEMIAAIQAGGKSTRMGRDKAWVELDELPLILHCVRAVSPLVSDINIIVSRDTPDLERYQEVCQENGLKLLMDKYLHHGPLGGISTALDLDTDDGKVLVLACDLPFVSSAFLSFLLNRHVDTEITAPSDESGKLQMLCAIYNVSCRTIVDKMIREGVYKVQELRSRAKLIEVRFEEYAHLEGAPGFLRNINSPTDLV